jgi:glyoxylase-like metal-dependent hydrolase (beta-lactamase superfamily II)
LKPGRGRGVRTQIRTIPVPTPFPVGPVNVYLVSADPVTLIDTGPLTEKAWNAVVAGLKAEGLSLRDVKRILLTHGHQDHFGLALRLAEASGAALLGGRLDRTRFRGEWNTKRCLDEMARGGFGLADRFGVMAIMAALDRFARPLETWDELSGGEVLEGDGWSVVVRSTPGHTPGCLTFQVPEADVVFTGDTVLRDITPNAIVDEDPERPGEDFRSLSRYFETLSELREKLAGALLLTGHGEPILDFPAHLDRVSARYDKRIEKIEAALSRGPMNARELVVDLFPRISTPNLFLAWSEVVGFLMYMEDEGKVEKVAGKLQDRWRLAG